MSVETDLFDRLKPLVANRVYPDVAPQDLKQWPYITYQQVGGDAVNFLEAAVASKKNARFQVNTWGRDRPSVAALARSVEDTLKTSPLLQVTILGAPVALYEANTKLFGARQDFSVWF